MMTSKIVSLVKTSSTFGAFKQIEEMKEIFVEDIRSLLSSPQHTSLSHVPRPPAQPSAALTQAGGSVGHPIQVDIR